jgi:hypothetical protein
MVFGDLGLEPLIGCFLFVLLLSVLLSSGLVVEL